MSFPNTTFVSKVTVIARGWLQAVNDFVAEGPPALSWGADNTGATDSTAALLAFFNYIIPRGLRGRMAAGTYTVSGPISTSGIISSGSLHLVCEGDVTITVAPGATAFTRLLTCYTTAANNCTITGGTLTINGNNRVSSGVYIRHAGGWSGSCILSNLTVYNCKENDPSSVEENQGIFVYGRYERVHLINPIVYNVDRTNTGGGACSGISISDIQGQCVIDNAYVANILCTGGTDNADGIKVFGYALGTSYQERAGYIQINNPVAVDCQGRSIKLQTSEAEIFRPRCYRHAVVTVATVDIDSQTGGNTTVIEPMFSYTKLGGVSPLNASFYPISLQMTNSSIPNRMSVRGGTIRSDVVMPRFCLPYMPNAASLGGEFSVEEVECQSFGALAGSSMFTRAFCEFDAVASEAMTGSLNISLHNNTGNLSGIVLLGYTNVAGTATPTKLSFDLTDNTNTGADSASSKVFAALSGTIITSVDSKFRVSGNSGLNDYLGTWNVDAKKLRVGCRYSYDRATSTLTNGPTVVAGTYCAVECLGQLTNGIRLVRITVDDAIAVYQSYDQINWGVIKLSGTGDPAGVYTAPKGTIYSRIDGSSTSTRLYVNTDGVTAWTAITTAT